MKKIAYKDKAEWLELRKQLGIGGSEAGAAIGMNPYKSPYTLWAEKTGKVPEFEGNLTTEVGSYLEDFVAKLFEKETGKKVRRENKMLVNEDYPFAFADIDRTVVGENSVVEIKTTNSFPAMKQFRNGEFPEQWYCQIMHYMAVGNYDKAYLAVLIGCRDFKIFEIERDEEEIKSLMTAEERFWEYVKTNQPPVADGAESTTETISTIFPESSNEDNVNLDAYETNLEQYMALSKQIKELTALRDESVNRIKAFMGEAGKGESNSYKVSWSSYLKSSFDTKKFVSENPNLDLSKYYKSAPVRPFKVTEKEAN